MIKLYGQKHVLSIRNYTIEGPIIYLKVIVLPKSVQKIPRLTDPFTTMIGQIRA